MESSFLDLQPTSAIGGLAFIQPFYSSKGMLEGSSTNDQIEKVCPAKNVNSTLQMNSTMNPQHGLSQILHCLFGSSCKSLPNDAECRTCTVCETWSRTAVLPAYLRSVLSVRGACSSVALDSPCFRALTVARSLLRLARYCLTLRCSALREFSRLSVTVCSCWTLLLRKRTKKRRQVMQTLQRR